MKGPLDALNATATEVAAKVKHAKRDARAWYREEVAGLRYRSKVAAAKLDELKSAGDGRWAAMGADMDKLRGVFVHSLHDLKSQI